jgi:hypothetical protein
LVFALVAARNNGGVAMSPLNESEAPHREWLDHELHRWVFNYLSLRGIPGLESIQLTVTNGNVRLDGTTPSRSAKWRCSECCRYVAGVFNVFDRLVVVPPDLDVEPSDQRPRKPR